MEDVRSRRTARIEAALWIVLGTLAFLSKGNPALDAAAVLPLFLLLLGSSLAASLAARRWPARPELHALALIAGFAAIAGLQERSGGAQSTLWVLYLLPIFQAAILLDGRALAWTAAGACAADAALYLSAAGSWNAELSFELALKTGILASAAAATWLLSRAESDADERSRRRRETIARLERSLRAQAAERERERGLTAIAAGGAGAAHDLATPLMVVRAYAKLHLERGVADPELMRDLGRIDAAAGFCQELIVGLLAQGTGPTAPRRLEAAVESALALAEPILRARRVVLEREYPERPLAVAAAPNDVERIVLNLVGNAAKASGADARVRVRVARDDGGSWPWAVVTVDDDGPGIAPEILPRLFQPFATTRANQGGTGLGLYLSREAARRLGGALDAENRAEGGARFTLRLPLAPSPLNAAPA
ncbi:MAG: HAMP domain-containing histidine kinase [Elusimicrobia bacterium]|nr:HAMP domain-containing histidine kinase [Elusimicrobiota bacterium]